MTKRKASSSGGKKAAVKNSGKEKVENASFGGAFGLPMGGASSGFPWNQGSPFTAPVEQVGTIFKNLRYYFISNFRQILCQAYVEFGLVQTIVDVPVDDGLRGGIVIKSKQLEEEQIAELQVSLDRDNDIQEAGQAAKWNRLFGGAGILILTEQNPETPLELESLNRDSKLEFRAVDMWELFWDQQNTEGFDPEIQEENFEFYNYYAVKVHKSRVMRLKGLEAPSFLRPRLRGWGFSVVEALVRSLNQYLKGTDLGFEVLDEFKVDVYRFDNLVNTLLSPNGEQKVRQRVQQANYLKNYQNAVVLDKNDEFDHKQLSFAGIAEAMAGIRMQVAADMRMPLTKLFGISAAGFNSGEDDIEVYNSMVESQVRNKIKYDLLRICEIKCQKLFGFIPDDMSIEFKPLRIMSSEQEENVKNAKFNRLLSAKSAGEITTFEFREGCNRDNLLGISLDTMADGLNPDDPDVAALMTDTPIDGTDVEDPGANRADTRKPRAWDAGKQMTGHGSEEQEAQNKPAKLAKPAKESKVEKESQPPKLKNTLAYDKAAFETDAPTEPFDKRRLSFIKDARLFSEMREKASQAYGKENLEFAFWLYKKAGGKI